MGVNEGDKLRKKLSADRDDVALTLQHAREAREVRLQPILLGIELRRETQIADHRVDVVFEFRDFASRADLDGACQIALCHSRRHFGDGSHLGGEIGREKVDVTGQIFPRSRGARNVGLTAEAAFDTNLTCHRRHLIGEERQRVRHVVDGFGERRDLALGFHTVSLGLRSPLATAVTTLTMPRTCSVRFAAMTFTVSVKSFHVPATRAPQPGRRGGPRCRLRGQHA